MYSPMGALLGEIAKLGSRANSFSYALVSGLLDNIKTHLDVGAVVVIAVELEMSFFFCTVDIVAVDLKF